MLCETSTLHLFHGLQMLISLPSWLLSQTRARSAQGAEASSEPWSSLPGLNPCLIWSRVTPPPKSNGMRVKQARSWVKLSKRWSQQSGCFPLNNKGPYIPRHPVIRGQCLRDPHPSPIRIHQTRASPLRA